MYNVTVDNVPPPLPQECCLCQLRGGALKPTSTGKWAHVVCAVTVPEVGFGDTSRREPVQSEAITRARKRLVSTTMSLTPLPLPHPLTPSL